MRRFALIGLSVLLSGCSGFPHFLDDTFGVTPNHNAPLGDSQNLRRARGEWVDIAPLRTEPGDVWPGPPQPEPTLSDIQKQQGALSPSLGAPTPPPDRTIPSSQGRKGFKTVPDGKGSIAIPNGNGTSTIIAPDGSVTTVPTPQ